MTRGRDGKRILFCCNIYPPHFVGGAELIAHFQAKSLQAKGNSVLVFAGESKPRGTRYTLHREAYDGLRVVRIQLGADDYRSDRINFFHREVEDQFQIVLDEFQPEVVHFHNIIGLSVGMLYLAKRSGATTIQTLHDKWGICFKTTTLDGKGKVCGDYSKCSDCMAFIDDGGHVRLPIRFRQDYIKLQFSYLDRIISPSHYLADSYAQAGFPKEKMLVLWNGVDVERFAKVRRQSKTDEIRFTYIGHFGNHKGVEVLLRALPLLDKNKKVRLNLVGEGEAKGHYIELLNQNHCADLVNFWGKVENRSIEKVYQDTDVLVLPSVGPENQPVSITEAMACNLPVITSRLGGATELVDDGVTGFLFESGNEGALAAKMNEFIRDPDLIKVMGQRGYEKIKNTTLSNQVEELERIYDEASGRSLESRSKTVAVAGQQVDYALAQGIEMYMGESVGRKKWFVKDDWLREEQLQDLDLMCIADEKDWLLPTIKALKNRIPLLVPETNQELKSLCITAACGLYYKEALEAKLCLEHLLESGGPGVVMGNNGHQFLNE